MEVRLTPELEARLKQAADETSSPPDEYDEWFRQQVRKGIDQLDSGETLSHEQVGARIQELFNRECKSGGLPAVG